MKFLDAIKNPSDLRLMARDELPQIAAELREEVVSVISGIGGHFASTLGAVELTLALHYSFKTPEDCIVWDTGHQGYAHKLPVRAAGPIVHDSTDDRCSSDCAGGS